MVGIVTRLRSLREKPAVWLPTAEVDIALSLNVEDQGLTKVLFSSAEDISSEIKQPACEVDLSPPYSVKVYKEWKCTSTFRHDFM